LKQDEKEEVTEVSSDVEADDMKCIAQAAEHDLLKQGSHALLEENRRSIWVFCLSEIEKENALQVLTPDNFECGHDQRYKERLLINHNRSSFWLCSVVRFSHDFSTRNNGTQINEYIEILATIWRRSRGTEHTGFQCKH